MKYTHDTKVESIPQSQCDKMRHLIFVQMDLNTGHTAPVGKHNLLFWKDMLKFFLQSAEKKL